MLAIDTVPGRISWLGMIHLCAWAFVLKHSLPTMEYRPVGIVSANVGVSVVHVLATAAVVLVQRQGMMLPGGAGTNPSLSQMRPVKRSVIATPDVACIWISSNGGIRNGDCVNTHRLGLAGGMAAAMIGRMKGDAIWRIEGLASLARSRVADMAAAQTNCISLDRTKCEF